MDLLKYHEHKSYLLIQKWLVIYCFSKKAALNFHTSFACEIFKIVKITRRERNDPNVTPLKHGMPNVIYDLTVSRDKIIFSFFFKSN